MENTSCFYCGISFENVIRQRDHVIPRAHGGTEKSENVVPACIFCNMAKGDRTLAQFLAWLDHVRSEQFVCLVRERGIVGDSTPAVCIVCKKEFTSKRVSQKFCSRACKQANYMARLLTRHVEMGRNSVDSATSEVLE